MNVKNSLKGVKILVVEDNEINITLVTQIIKSWDVECDIARNGLQAVEKARTVEYDLILMDLEMPEMDGYEATSAIRQLPIKKAKTLPIIAFTSSQKFEIEDNATKAGLNDYLGKPFDLNELYAKIELYCTRKAVSSTRELNEINLSITSDKLQLAADGTTCRE